MPREGTTSTGVQSTTHHSKKERNNMENARARLILDPEHRITGICRHYSRSNGTPPGKLTRCVGKAGCTQGQSSMRWISSSPRVAMSGRDLQH